MHLTTQRLLVRPIRDDDFEALRAIAAHPDVFRFRSRSSMTEEETRAFIARAQQAWNEQPPASYGFALALRTTGLVIGECGLTRLDETPQSAFLWYSLNRSFWGQGYMSEGAYAVVDAGFRQAGLSEIVASCHAENDASSAILRRIFQTGGRADETGAPMLHFAIKRAAWLAAG